MLLFFFINILQIEYSDDEEVTCTSFTRDFYKLVNIKSESTKSLQPPVDETHETATSNIVSDKRGGSVHPQNDSDDSDDGSTYIQYSHSPTASEAGLTLVSSCSSSDSNGSSSEIKTDGGEILVPITALKNTNSFIKSLVNQSSLNTDWRQSTGWRRVRPNLQQVRLKCSYHIQTNLSNIHLCHSN